MPFFTRLLSTVILLVMLGSCASRQRITYFNDLLVEHKIDSAANLQPILIQSGDILQVTISSALNKDLSLQYNPLTTYGAPNPGYLVDRDGNIELPVVGKLYVRGKTTESINEDIRNQVSKSIKNVFVSTRLMNFRVSILGDVARPGSYPVANERVSILEALSLAGDANLSARRNDVLLIRDREGKKEYITLDLNDSKTLSSPYYYLSNNDIIYVKPGTNRVIASTTGFQLLPTIFSAVSLILVLYTTLRK